MNNPLDKKIMFQMGDEMLDIDNMVIPVEDVKSSLSNFFKELEEEQWKAFHKHERGFDMDLMDELDDIKNELKLKHFGEGLI